MASSTGKSTLSSKSSKFDNPYVYSHKRYFVNNVDSYHGKYIVEELSKILDQNEPPQPPMDILSYTGFAEDGATVVPPLPVVQPYEVIGTATIPDRVKKLKHAIKVVSKEGCIEHMLSSGTVVLDISYDREELRIATEYLQCLKLLLEKQTPAHVGTPKESGDGDEEVKKRQLVFISTVMTWANTKPLDLDNPEMPFVETDFRKRKPHVNFKMHYDAENEVIGIARNFKSQISAIVVGRGLTYGGAEDVLFYWFQKAWENEHLLPIIGRGGNIVPLINVRDLASIVYNLVIDFPKKLYILAVEQNPTKQREIIKPIGRIVGTGMFKCIPPEDAFLIPEIDQRIFDILTVNLAMEPTFITETMGLQWTSELSFAENVPALIKQFKKERGLKCTKVLIYGPPLVGKTTLAKMICTNYGLVYVSYNTVVQDLMDDLTWRVAHWEVGEMSALPMPVTEDDDVPDSLDDLGEEETGQETARQTLAILQSGRQFTEEEIIGYLRSKLLSHEAQNKGWVLDGFPTTLAQCSALFEKGEEGDDEVEAAEEDDEDKFEEDIGLYANVLKRMLPDFVISLVATDIFICEKAMRQPDSAGRLDEEVVLRRLSEFRVGDTQENTPLNFFDEIDIHPTVVNINNHDDYGMEQAYSAITVRFGQPCKYGKLIAMIEAAEKKAKQDKKEAKLKEEKRLRELEKKLKEEREEKMEYWSELYSLMREEEEAALAVAGEPMRNYLIHHIFPTLTPALLEVAKLRPEDPIDFLAEYLFKLNPTGRMLEPGYNLQAELLLGRIKILDDALKEVDIKIDPLFTPDAEPAVETMPHREIANMMSAL